MEASHPVSSTWAFTDIQVVDLTATWTINNFHFNAKHDRISSPKFVDNENNFTWSLELDLNSKFYPKDLAATITFVNSNTVDQLHCTKTWVKTRFSILNCKGKVKHQTSWSSYRPFCRRMNTQQREIISQSQLYGDPAGLLPFDSLTLFCEIKVKHGVTHISSEDFQDFWTGRQSDILLSIDGKSFPAHKEILLLNPVFQSLIEKEPNVEVIALDDFNYDIMLEVLRFIYFEDVRNINSDTVTLMAAADKYKVWGLKSICEKKLISALNILNASSLLSVADLYQASDLKSNAIKFIVSHNTQVSQTPGYKYLKSASDQKLISETYLEANAGESSLSYLSSPESSRYSPKSIYSPISPAFSPESPENLDNVSDSALSSLDKNGKPIKKRKVES